MEAQWKVLLGVEATHSDHYLNKSLYKFIIPCTVYVCRRAAGATASHGKGMLATSTMLYQHKRKNMVGRSGEVIGHGKIEGNQQYKYRALATTKRAREGARRQGKKKKCS